MDVNSGDNAAEGCGKADRLRCKVRFTLIIETNEEARGSDQ
jgi:hypothetical protein